MNLLSPGQGEEDDYEEQDEEEYSSEGEEEVDEDTPNLLVMR